MGKLHAWYYASYRPALPSVWSTFPQKLIARRKLRRSKTNLSAPFPKPVLPPAFLISVNDITILSNVQAPTLGIILASPPSLLPTYHMNCQIQSYFLFIPLFSFKFF